MTARSHLTTTTTTTTTTTGRYSSVLKVASIPRSSPKQNNLVEDSNIVDIDMELSSIQNDLSSSSSSSSSTIMQEMHSILDDGHGHINKDLATSIWTWENENLHPMKSNPFPLASKLTYSTRDGLRLVEATATDIMMKKHGLSYYCRLENNTYNDLVQEGVVALMKSMVDWEKKESSSDDNKNGGDENNHNVSDPNKEFESFAKKQIRKAMTEYVKKTNDDVGVLMNVLQRRKEEEEKNRKRGTNTNEAASAVAAPVSEPCDQIVQPLREAVLDENPTPDEIALSDMIRKDIGAFLERTLNEEELMVIRMRFGLEEVDTSLKAVSVYLGKSVNNVQEIEYEALKKLRMSFSNDYIGAYLDCDNTEEVSL